MATVSCRPIIAICGTTGVGKSKLAIDLALHLNRTCHKDGWRCAKIINADSMQVYQGLDVLTNKVPEVERQGVPHLLMGFKKPGQQYVVGEWVQDAINLIDDMHKNHELPIVVGGTSYWMQHLIFPNRLVSKDPSSTKDPQAVPWSESIAKSFALLPPELITLLQNLPEEAPSAKSEPDQAFQLHKLLSALDPIMSQRWHWKDSRKVLRSLQILKESGKRPSSLIEEQSSSDTIDNAPRFQTLCLWLYANPTRLNDRLNIRVDKMISQGLLDEVKTLREMAKSGCAADFEETTNTDYTVGIYQSIGFREFCAYLDTPSEKTYQEATERTKISTRQYAKRQISWIRNKLVPAVNAANIIENIVPLYLLDATTLGDDWLTNVQIPAFELQDAFLAGCDMPDPKSLSENALKLLNDNHKDVDPASVLKSRKRRICTVCTSQEDRPVMIEEGFEWDLHVQTRSHRRRATKLLASTDLKYSPKQSPKSDSSAYRQEKIQNRD